MDHHSTSFTGKVGGEENRFLNKNFHMKKELNGKNGLVFNVRFLVDYVYGENVFRE